MTQKVSRLLKQYIASLPDRRRRMRERSPDLKEDRSRFKVGPPEAPVQSIPTFDSKVVRPLSPQLREWHAIVGTLVESSWKYLSPTDIKVAVKSSAIKKIVRTHREYWDDSAPMQFQNSQLSLFALIGHPDDGDLIYLVWREAETAEPELWEYFGQSETRYQDLEDYLAAQHLEIDVEVDGRPRARRLRANELGQHQARPRSLIDSSSSSPPRPRI